MGLNNLIVAFQFSLSSTIFVIFAMAITHFESEAAIKYDKWRQKEIESPGIKFIRFRDDDVRDNMEEVLRVIKNIVARHK